VTILDANFAKQYRINPDLSMPSPGSTQPERSDGAGSVLIPDNDIVNGGLRRRALIGTALTAG